MLTDNERAFLEVVSQLLDCNPFSPDRPRLEKQALGDAYVEGETVWTYRATEPQRTYANALALARRGSEIAIAVRDRLAGGEKGSPEELRLYEDAVLHHLYWKLAERFLVDESSDGGSFSAPFYSEFLRDWNDFFHVSNREAPDAAHTFAVFFQIRRAFRHIFTKIIGGSAASTRLRVAVWQSIFTHDMRRYRRSLYHRMGDFTTLITGPSGTGKELVARAIAYSRYWTFDERKLVFQGSNAAAFHPVNLSALSPTLIESELFGHRRGAFTGAVRDRKGWLEICPDSGAVFLDEIGDLETEIQVKLLRVIETRNFQPVGETATRSFGGKLVAATNVDLAAAMQAGAFRPDFYYRLCSDQIQTTPLASQLRESPAILGDLLIYLSRRIAGDEAEALAQQTETWIRRELGDSYAWPGNYRELEQCVRNVLIRGEYRPRQTAASGGLWDGASEGSWTAEELLRRYITLVYAQAGGYAEAARRLELDQRTVKSKVDLELLEQFRESGLT
ncbi:MAG: sigma-54 factor interaction domain-containing protein [Bryobacterales bacterium]